ncbi:MAG: ATP-binding protein [Syntrophales bacterium]|nr:ATP-binding protein [Syntrophales bacterium]
MFENQGGQAFFALVPAIAGCIVFYSLSLVALVRHDRKHSLNRLFAVICFLGGLANTNMILVTAVTQEDLALRIDRLVYIVFIFSVPLYLQFTHSCLDVSRKWLEKAVYAVTFSILPFTQSEYFIRGHQLYYFGRIAQAGPLFHLFLALAAAVVIYCLFLFLKGIHNAGSNHRRNRLKYIFFGFGVGTLLFSLNAVPASGIALYPPGHFTFIPALVLAYGVLKHDLLDIKTALGTGIFYLFFAGTVTLLYIVIIYALSHYLKDFPGISPLVLAPVLAIPVFFIFDPLRKKIEHLMERYFFRGSHNYRLMLKELSGKLTSLLRLEEIGNYLADSIYTTLNPSAVSLWVFNRATEELELEKTRGHFTVDLPLIRKNIIQPLKLLFRDTQSPLSIFSLTAGNMADDVKSKLGLFFESSRISLIFPILFKDNLSGVMLVGEKKSGDLYSSEDIELLATIANQAAVAVTNARSLEELEKMNQLLEKKVAERTEHLTKLIEEKERTRQQLIRSESLAAIGQLVAGTAHELNNPLTGASSLLELSLETLSESEYHRERYADVLDDLAFSLKELKRAGAIIRSLLSLSRQTDELMEPVDINLVLQDALRILHSSRRNANAEIVVDFDAHAPAIEGNFAHLGQAFINIIKNAMQSLPAHGGIVNLISRYNSDRDCILVECRDNGCGIAAHQIGEVCKPFMTTKAVGEGTGLGMYITHEIIRGHEGLLHIESSLEKGTRVKVEIPVKRKQQTL